MVDIIAKLRSRGHSDLAASLERIYLEGIADSVAENVRNADSYFESHMDELDELGFLNSLTRTEDSARELKDFWDRSIERSISDE